SDGSLELGAMAFPSVVVAPGDVVISNIAGQAYSAYENLFNAGLLVGTDYFFTHGNGQYSSYEYDFSGGNDFLGSKFFYTGITGKSYTGEEADYDGGGNVTRVGFTGVTGAAYSSYEY